MGGGGCFSDGGGFIFCGGGAPHEGASILMGGGFREKLLDRGVAMYR